MIDNIETIVNGFKPAEYKLSKRSFLKIALATFITSSCAYPLGNYAYLKDRTQIRKRCSDKVKFNIDIRTKNPSSSEVISILELLENVPDKIQQKLNDFGGKIIIHDGKYTDLEEFRHLKGKINLYTGRPFDDDDPRGRYDPKKKIATIKEETAMLGLPYLFNKKGPSNATSEMTCASLHETGHMFYFYCLSKGLLLPRDSEKFPKDAESIYNKCKKKYLGFFKAPKIWEYGFKNNWEFFAELFSMYFFSDTSRKEFSKNIPEAYKVMDDLVKKVMSN